MQTAMKHTTLVATLLLGAAAGSAQSLDRQVIGSTGGYTETGNLSVSYTVGETVIETAEAGTIVLTQGFQQPDEQFIGIEVAGTGIAITAYPNPTEGIIILDIRTVNPEQLTIAVFDAAGRQVLSSEMLQVHTEAKHPMDFSSLAAGNYLIRLSAAEGSASTLKVLKVD
jgi:hypothetical protein